MKKRRSGRRSDVASVSHREQKRKKAEGQRSAVTAVELYNIILVDARLIARLKAEQEQVKIIQDISRNDKFRRGV